MANNDRLPVDDLVKKLLVSGEKPTDIQNIYGFVGPSESDDHITLYLDANLHRAISIRKEDILHSIKITKTHNPLGGTLIWVKNGTAYLHYGGVERKEEAEKQATENPYLQGNIYQNYATQVQESSKETPSETKPKTEDNTDTKEEN